MNNLPELSGRQNPDGGWPYGRGSSWTEPTVYALLALVSKGEVSSFAVSRALEWLKASQRPDGGWSPRRPVEESTWVTALVLLLPASMLTQFNTPAAVSWLLAKTGRESGWVHRLRSAMISGQVQGRVPDGWPWFPDTAAWVAPTSIAILALRKAFQRDPRHQIHDRVQDGQEFLMSRVCADGGWNHGSTKALGYDGPSYPETTGLALAALKGLQPGRLARGIERAEQHLETSRSLEAASWLQLGLLAQNRRPLEAPSLPVSPQRSYGTQEAALAVIAQQALRGRNVLED
ncbi:MAG TPA: prenyltransferase/squalene oxidase repeat-containing protein [Bryobacteraceae bacterium]|nr:prenyltransferase/squalene oxidase repeat-containing protein [Bryobacteraceae bacterium]